MNQTALSNPGLAGAAIGLALGLVEYVVAMAMIRAHTDREIDMARKENEVLPGIGILPATLRKLRIILIVTAVTIYPVVGYFVGNMVAT